MNMKHLAQKNEYKILSIFFVFPLEYITKDILPQTC